MANQVLYILKLQDKFSAAARKITLENKRLEKGLKSTKESVAGMTSAFKNVINTGVQFGKKMTAGLTLPIAFAAKKMVDAARDADEARSKFATVFQDVGDKAEAMKNSIAKNYGLSRLETTELMASTGDLLTGFGFSGDMALDLSSKVQKLAVDLASFTNLEGGATRASAALTKALLGERESVKSLGISILEEDVKAKVKSLAVTGVLTGMTMRQAKAYATLEIAAEQSKNAIGDFARTQDSLANRQRVLKARLNDVTVALGQKLLPIALKITNGILKMVEKFNGLSESTKKYILIAAGILAVLGPLIVIFGSIASAVLSLTALFALFGITTLAALWPILAVIAAFAAGVWLGNQAVDFLRENSMTTWKMIGDVIGETIKKAQEFIDIITESAFVKGIAEFRQKKIDLVSKGFEFVLGEGQATSNASEALAAAITTNKEEVIVTIAAPEGVVQDVKRKGAAGTRRDKKFNVGLNTVPQ